MLVRSWLVALTLLLSAGHAGAGPIFTVNSLVDAPGGGSLIDGVCETATGNHACTLRAAVMEANHVAGGGATIVIPAQTYFLTRAPSIGNETDGDLDLTAAMTIVGAGPSATVIDGNLLDRVFDVANGSVTLRGLSAQNGISVDGGGIRNGGGLTLENVAVVGCFAGNGGGISNSGTLTIRHGVVSNGSTSIPGGQAGGGIYNAVGGTVRIEDSLVANSSAESGGGVANAGSATIERTSFLGNGSSSSGAAGFGGGAVFNTGTLAISNSTLSQNSAEQHGGGLYAKGGTTELVHVTITDNRANRAGLSGGTLGGGITAEVSPGVVLRSSIVAGNLSGTGTAPSECSGSILSGDYNLIGVRSTCTLTGATAHVNVADAPGITFQPFPSGGFASDVYADVAATIPLASCTDALGAPLAVDGRGYSRGSTGFCQIGAYESSGAYAPASPLRIELLRNGGAVRNELGRAAVDASPVDPPYWATTGGQIDQVVYGSPGGFPVRGDAPARSGSYFFAGGTEDQSQAVQSIDISAAAAKIDAGNLPYRLAGAFGGNTTDDDFAMLTLGFRDVQNDPISDVTIGGFDAADRGFATKLKRDSANGLVPVGTRFLQVSLLAVRIGGAENDGYADQLSLSVPEPSATIAGLGAAIALALRARRRG